MDSFKITKLKKYKKRIIYGAGDYARRLLQTLKNYGIAVDYCVVTDKKENPDFLEDIPVCRINTCYADMQREDTVILIGVSSIYEKEIINMLLGYNIYNYLIIDDLYRNNSVTLNDYKNKTVQDCMEEIVEWYLDSDDNGFENYDQVMTRMKSLLRKEQKTREKIIFAVGDLSPRVIKIAKALSEKEYEIKVYICPGALIRQVCSSELQELNIFCHVCEYVEEIMYYMIVEKPWVIHIFSGWGDSISTYFLVKMKELFPKIVYDKYDIFNGMYAYISAELLEAERYCLENADGICNRGYELEYLMNETNYNIKGKTIQFLDYCKDGSVDYVYRDEKEPLTLCYAGSIQTEKSHPDSSVACWLSLAEMCEKNKCHLHIYPMTWDKKTFAEYMELDSVNKFFHFHKPVPYMQIEKELSQYDYMVHPIRAGFLSKEINGIYYRRKGIYGCSNKFFDSLDAGLPIIGISMTKFTKFLEERGVCIRWAIEEYDFNLLKEKRNELRKKVVLVHKELQIKEHINELIKFYNSL